jgi:DNA-binding NarL/FixJ family response regulator
MSLRKYFGSYKLILLFGVSLAALLFLMRWMEFRIQLVSQSTEIYVTIIAVIFTALGIWLALSLAKPKTVVIERVKTVEKPSDFVRNDKLIEKLGLSAREQEVLQFMADGLTNNEIAERMFVSLNTVKTHSSNLFAKLDVNRRTQAIDFAKKNRLIS